MNLLEAPRWSQGHPEKPQSHSQTTFVLHTLLFICTWPLLFKISEIFLILPGISFCFMPTAVTFLYVFYFGRKALAFCILGPMFNTLLVKGFNHEFLLHFQLDIRHVICFAGAGLLTQSLIKSPYPTKTLRDTGRFLAIVILAGLISGLGVALILGTPFNLEQFPATVITFWIGDTNGILLIVPFITSIRSATGSTEREDLSWTVMSLTFLCCFLSIWLSFGIPTLFNMKIQLWYLILLPIMWSAFSQGPKGTAFTMFLSGLAIVFWLQVYGLAQKLLELQFFFLIIASAGYCLGAAMGDRKKALEAVSRQERNLQTLVEHRTEELRLEVEERRKAEQKAMAASEAKSAFLANMSHEIRTPLNGIMGMSHLLYEEEQDPELRDSLGVIHQCGEHLLKILNDILDLSKIEADRLELCLREENPTRILMDTAMLFEGHCKQKGCHIDVLVHGSIPKTVWLDDLRLRQILNNLCGNAVKFTESGYILLELSGDWDESGTYYLTFSIQDTGIGINEKDKQKLFEPFTQADHSTTRRFGGTGLGLSITRRLVSLMEGDLKLQSEKGKGSTFSFKIPVRHGELPPRPTRARVQKSVAVAIPEPTRRVLKTYCHELGIPFEYRDTCTRQEIDDEPETLFWFEFKTTPTSIEDSDQVVLIGHAADHPGEGLRSRFIKSPLEKAEVVKYLVDRPFAKNRTEIIPKPKFHFDKSALIIEDNEINAFILREMLEQLGLTVRIRENAESGLQEARNSQFDIIFMDLHMPGLSGREAGKQLRDEGVTIPIVAVTAEAGEESRQACLQAGMSQFLTKPVRRQDLVGVLGDLFTGASRT